MSNKAKRLGVLNVITSVALYRGGSIKAIIEIASALQGIGINAETATSDNNKDSELNQRDINHQLNAVLSNIAAIRKLGNNAHSFLPRTFNGLTLRKFVSAIQATKGRL